jgi:hypothetical protein
MRKSTFVYVFFLSIFVLICRDSIFAAVPQISLKYSAPGTMDYCKSTLSTKLGSLGMGHSVHVGMYTLSNKSIIDALKSFADRGGKVCVIVDGDQYNKSKDMKPRLDELSGRSDGRVKIHLLGQPGTWQTVKTFHEKFSILKKGDDFDLMIGSYN